MGNRVPPSQRHGSKATGSTRVRLWLPRVVDAAASIHATSADTCFQSRRVLLPLLAVPRHPTVARRNAGAYRRRAPPAAILAPRPMVTSPLATRHSRRREQTVRLPCIPGCVLLGAVPEFVSAGTSPRMGRAGDEGGRSPVACITVCHALSGKHVTHTPLTAGALTPVTFERYTFADN